MSTPASRWTRRDLLRISAGSLAAAALPAWFVERTADELRAQEAKSPNERPNIALVGCGSRGMHVAKAAAQFGNIVAVCDLDGRHLEQARENFAGARAYSDFRKLCDAKSIDAVINGTPDHWHMLINLRAVRSGKDVYSEKPLTLTIDEGKRLVSAVRETGRILQTGSQQRSDARFRLACELVRNGRLGTLRRVRVWLPMGPNDGPFPEQPVPDGLDWDFWLGQTPEVPYVPERCHHSFRYWYDYSGGTMTDWGAHHNDIALWGLGRERSGPATVEGRALVEPVPGGYTAASEYEVKYTHPGGIEHVCRSTSVNNRFGARVREPGPGEKHHGVQFEGDGGWIYVTRGRIDASDPALLETPLPESAERLYVSDDHLGNFFECLGTRKAPVCDAEIGHRSASICHLGVIAIRLGRRLQWDAQKETFVGDEQANRHVAREMRAPWSYESV